MNTEIVSSTACDKRIKDSEYVIEKAKPEDYLTIIQLMNETFYKDEPTCLDLELNGNAPELDACIMESLKEGYSVVARNKSDRKIVACSINECSDKYSAEKKEKMAANATSGAVKDFLKFGAFLQAFPDIHNRFKTEQTFEMAYVFVSDNHRRKGLAQKVMQESLSLAKKMGFKLARCDATSFYTSKLCAKLNFTQINQFPFDSFLDENNEPILVPSYPHDTVRIYIKAL